MKRTVKKHWLTGLSLSLATVAVSGVVASCASETHAATNSANSNLYGLNNQNNPASPKSIETNPDTPLSSGQISYHDHVTKQIKTDLDNLDYLGFDDKNPTDISRITKLLDFYKANMDKGPLANFIKDYPTFEDSKNPDNQQSTNDFSSFFSNFKQKNILPTYDQLKDAVFLKGQPSDSWKYCDGVLAVLYSDPIDIINSTKLINLSGETEAAHLTQTYKEFNIAYNVSNFSKSFQSNFGNDYNQTCLSYQIYNLYLPLLKQAEPSVPTSTI